MTMEAGKWYVIGNAFQQLDDTLDLKVNEFFSDSEFAEGDMLFLVRPDGAYLPHYWNVENGKWSTNPKRFVENSTRYPSTTGVYIHKIVAGKVVFAGKVIAKALNFGTEEGNNWTLTALPSPEGKKLSEYKWDGCKQGDSLFIARDDGAYTAFYYFDEKGWSSSPKRFIAPTIKLGDGQAVYINKVSPDIGSVSVK